MKLDEFCISLAGFFFCFLRVSKVSQFTAHSHTHTQRGRERERARGREREIHSCPEMLLGQLEAGSSFGRLTVTAIMHNSYDSPRQQATAKGATATLTITSFINHAACYVFQSVYEMNQASFNFQCLSIENTIKTTKSSSEAKSNSKHF